MKKVIRSLAVLLMAVMFMSVSDCDIFSDRGSAQLQNKTAQQEQKMVETNQATLNNVQPPPRVTWSLERDNLIKRFQLMNDRAVVMYMYIFNYGIGSPIGYYQVNKVSSVNSQLTNPNQVILTDEYDTPGDNGYARTAHVVSSPAEDGSYGTNGDAIFGFTPDMVYIEHNMQYICATAPLNFPDEPTNLGTINVKDLEELTNLMNRLGK